MALHFISFRRIKDPGKLRADYRRKDLGAGILSIIDDNSVSDSWLQDDWRIYQKTKDAKLSLRLDLDMSGMITSGIFRLDGSNSEVEDPWERFSSIEINRELETVELYEQPLRGLKSTYLNNTVFLYSKKRKDLKDRYFDYSFLITSRLFNSLKALDIKII